MGGVRKKKQIYEWRCGYHTAAAGKKFVRPEGELLLCAGVLFLPEKYFVFVMLDCRAVPLRTITR